MKGREGAVGGVRQSVVRWEERAAGGTGRQQECEEETDGTPVGLLQREE